MMIFFLLFVTLQCFCQEQLSRYQVAYNTAQNAITNNIDLPDHVWYRAEIAKVISIVGFDVFKNHIEPYLYDWHLYGTQALVKVNNVTPQYFQDLSTQWSGMSIFFHGSPVGSFYEVKKQGVKGTDGRDMTLDDAEKYYSLLRRAENNEFFLFLGRGHKDEKLLRSPQAGILFCHGFYYGLIDYEKKNAIVYDRSNEDVKTINFSNSIPWDVLKKYGRGKASLFFNNDTLCLTFWDCFFDKKPEGQIVYQIRKPSDPIDLSLAESYQSFNGPIRFIDQSSAFAKYSHAWFSFYFYKLLIKDPIKKDLKAKSFLGKVKELLPFLLISSALVSLPVFGFCVILSLFFQPFSFKFKVTAFASAFLGLLINSFYFRGFYLEAF